jgi:uncharacterized protein involved in exopolysaccharide biosynthesis
LSENRLIDMASQDALLQRKQTMLGQQQALLSEITELNNYEAELATLTRNVNVLEERYAQHAIRLEQARLDEVLEESRITSINVIQPASFEQRPIAPNKKLCALAGLFAACAVAVSLPVLLELRRVGVSARATRSLDAVEQASPRTNLAEKDLVVASCGSQREESLVAVSGSATPPPHPR